MSSSGITQVIKTSSKEKEWSTYRLEETWLPVCTITIGIFTAFWVYFGILFPESYQDSKYTLVEPDGKKYWDNDVENRWLSVITIVAFITSISGSMFSLMFVNETQRPAIYCTIVISGVAAFTHYSFAIGSAPVFDSCFGRKMHTLRFAEWTSLVFLLMFVTNVIDKANRKEFIRSCLCQSFSVAMGCISSFSCHMNWGGDNLPVSDGHWMHRGISYPKDNVWYTPSAIYNSSRSFKLCLVLLLFSCILFCDIYRVAWQRLTCRRRSIVSSTSDGILAIWCSVSWSIVVLIYMMGCFNVFSEKSELVANILVDLVAKFIYAHILADTHQHLQNIEAEFTSKLKAKDKINESQTHFLRYVFHEVRVPLNTIRLGLDSINMSEQEAGVNLDEDLKYVFGCMDNATETMSDTLDDVLAYQKIKEGKIDLCMSRVKLREIVHDITAQFETSFEDKKLKIGVLVDPRIPTQVDIDGLRIRQVLSHFISSAIKNHQARTIIVSVFETQQVTTQSWLLDKLQMKHAVSYMKFSVHIDGVYIEMEDQANLFEAYTQIRTGDMVIGDGTSGLGLCICKRLVEIMGGSVGVDQDKNGHSSAFFFTLPLVASCIDSSTPTVKPRDDDNLLPALRRCEPLKSPLHTSQKATVAMPIKTPSSLTKSKEKAVSETKEVLTDSKKDSDIKEENKKVGKQVEKVENKKVENKKVGKEEGKEEVNQRRDVLVVDDVKLNRRLMKRCVDQLNVDCDEAEHGAQAVEMCRMKTYDLILMDNSMPIMTGVEATKAIRAEHGNKILVFGVTGNALSEDVAEFKQAGCNEVLLKPLDFNQFLRYLVKHGMNDEKVKSLLEKVQNRANGPATPSKGGD